MAYENAALTPDATVFRVRIPAGVKYEVTFSGIIHSVVITQQKIIKLGRMSAGRGIPTSGEESERLWNQVIKIALRHHRAAEAVR